MINLLAAMWVRFRWRWQETGLLTLHLGLLVLAGGEFITGAFADEGLMRIEEGGSASYTEDVREVELAVVEQGKEQDHDRVVSLPAPRPPRSALSG